MTCDECEFEAVAYIDCEVEDAAGLSIDQRVRQRIGLCISHAGSHGITRPLNTGRLVAKTKPGKAFGRNNHALAGSHNWVVTGG